MKNNSISLNSNFKSSKKWENVLGNVFKQIDKNDLTDVYIHSFRRNGNTTNLSRIIDQLKFTDFIYIVPNFTIVKNIEYLWKNLGIKSKYSKNIVSTSKVDSLRGRIIKLAIFDEVENINNIYFEDIKSFVSSGKRIFLYANSSITNCDHVVEYITKYSYHYYL